MDSDRQAIILGLSAGLGGFIGFLIVGCICWQVFCGSWCEKKSTGTPVKPIPVKSQRDTTTVTKIHPTNRSTMTPMKIAGVDLNNKGTAPNDLANRVKSVHR